ncbi:MAG: helix-turn-helix domain-containing protein [Mycobacteriaceae bacterium]
MTLLLREAIGDSLRRTRVAQSRTLREVSSTARVSLGYLSEVERGRKEASSELLAAICQALAVPMSEVLFDVSEVMSELGSPRRGGIGVNDSEPLTVETDSFSDGEQGSTAHIAESTKVVIPAPASMAAA